MLRSRTVHAIRELAAQGQSIHAIAREVGIARNTVRKYLRSLPPTAAARPKRPSKLEPFEDLIRRWVREDHLLNCVTMLERLRPLGYTGQISILKAFVHSLRPPKAGQHPVRRYETKPGEQMQFDWGEFVYLQDGRRQKLYGFTAVLSYSRMRFVCFTKRSDTPTLIRCLMAACDYFDGLPHAVLTDRMKSVLLQMDGTAAQWNPLFADFLTAIGVVPRVCRPFTPQTKGKVERSIGVIKQSFWPGVRFSDLFDLNAQAFSWCDRRNQQIHHTTRARPLDRWVEEGLQPLPAAYAWERFRSEDRRVSWDGYISYDGVLYGLPSEPPSAGTTVQVSVQRDTLTVWRNGQQLAHHTLRAISGTAVPHPDQFRTVSPAHTFRARPEPLAHLVEPAAVVQRPLSEYDLLCGVEVGPC